MQKRIVIPALAGLGLLISISLASLAQAATQPIDFRELVKDAMPAVVNISSERTEQVRNPMPFGGMFRGNPDLDRFFGPFTDEFFNHGPRERRTNSLGSGFIISSDGYIVTNNHVVENADVIRVNIGAKYNKDDLIEATVVGTDPETDLALLKIKAEDLPYLKFGDSDALEVGEWVVAIGSPLGLHHTVTAGIVSAKGRNIQSGSYDDFLQTDASINRGNSGGPLLNMDGEVVGINTAIAQRAQGIGFAIPSTMAKRIIDQIRDGGKVSRGWLGVSIQNVDAATAKALAMPNRKGALVNSVLDGQPAAVAGIKDGDVIIAIDKQPIEDTEQLLRRVAMLVPGSKATISVWRDGKKLDLALTVAERGAGGQAKGKEDGIATEGLLGLKVRPLTGDDMRRLELNTNVGLLVTGLTPDSPAAKAGIVPGDVLLAADRLPITSVADLVKKIEAAEKGRGAVLLHISRQGQTFFRAIEIPKK
jgi:serine protease Do